MLLLILDTKTGLDAMNEGITLCLYSVIPSLFPFFILSSLIVSSLRGQGLPFLRPIGKLCGIPQGCEGLLAVALLGGYPVGARSVAQYYQDGIISKAQAERLLSFCSNAGPSFIFGIVGSQFSSPSAPWFLWLIHIFSAITVGALFPGKKAVAASQPASSPLTLTEALLQSIHSIVLVCGWVVLFRVLGAYCDNIFLSHMPDWSQILFYGIMELTSGCFALRQIGSEAVRFLAASGFLAFGGLCVAVQTASVTKGLRIHTYLWGKLLQTVISIVTAWLLIHKSVWGTAAMVTGAIFCRWLKKIGGNPAAVRV